MKGPMIMDNQSLGEVLLVDDEEAFCLTTAELLSRAGYHCDAVSGPQEALTVLPGNYEVLITDIHMPGNSGLEFLREVRQQAPELPMIVVTGYPSVPTAVEALHLSAVDYLLKPLKVPELIQSVAKAIQRGQLMRAVRYTKTTTEEWGQVMGHLEQSINENKAPGDQTNDMEWTMDRFLEQSMAHLGKLTSGIQQTLAVVQKDQALSTVNVCDLLACPRLERYEEVLRETVVVLEKTKRAFKSKGLGELREKIGKLLERDNNTGDPTSHETTQSPKTSGE